MIRVVILAPSGAAPFESLQAEDVQVTDITSASAGGVIELPSAGPWVRHLDAWARRTALGRVLRRLTPLDPGVGFWHATRRSARARRALEEADIIVTIERDARFAAYRWARVRRGQPVAIVDGYAAARVRIAARYSVRVAEDESRGSRPEDG